jgi:hypothetical protein
LFFRDDELVEAETTLLAVRGSRAYPFAMRSARIKALVHLALPLLLACAPGCASAQDHTEKQLTKLEDEVRHLQSETDRMGERLDAVETRSPAPHSAEERVAANGTTVTRPKLKVVRVEPGADEAAQDEAELAPPAPDASEADNGPRLLIQGEGKSIESRTLPGGASIAAKSAPVAKAAPSAKSKAAEKANKAEAPSSK